MAKKTFREKLADKGLPKVEPLSGGMEKRYGPGTILIPAPYEVKQIMDEVPFGRVITINDMRQYLADQHGATMACPIVTGILARIVAGAAGEDEADGETSITPYWRTLKSGGLLNEKYPGGLLLQKQRLEQEGHQITVKRKRYLLEQYEDVTHALT